jgi:5-methylcytosine-specific restriction protein A
MFRYLSHLFWRLVFRPKGRSPLWKKVRDSHLIRFPVCACCGSRRNLTVHHIWPVSWPHGHVCELIGYNLITLCESPTHNCHLWVGHLGDWKSRNPHVRMDAARMRQRIESRPYPAKELP